MAARATIACIWTDADVGLASLLRRILESIPPDQVGHLRVEDLRGAGSGTPVVPPRRAAPDLAILIPRAEAARCAEADVAALKSGWPGCPLLVILPGALAPEALRLLEAGAAEFVLPPIRPEDLIPRVVHLLRSRNPEERLVAHLKEVAGSRQIIGHSPALLAQLRRLPLIAGCDATVLIAGETGTGKELCARAIHHLSRRAGNPFVPVDCGAIPAELIENELFGHERGAYTQAHVAQPGLLEEAEGGTLFLDEIDALSVPMQSKLLRFLQEKEYRPLGSPKPRRVDVRVIAATNIPLEGAVSAGRFRQDLYYRLHVLSMVLPPLRERREDIPLLARHFLANYAAEFRRPARDIADDAMERLLAYAWPGNARELENVVQRAVLLCESSMIEAQNLALPPLKDGQIQGSFRARKARVVQEFERDYLTALLATHDGNVSAAARAAQKDRRALWELLRKHQLLPRHEPPSPRLSP